MGMLLLPVGGRRSHRVMMGMMIRIVRRRMKMGGVVSGIWIDLGASSVVTGGALFEVVVGASFEVGASSVIGASSVVRISSVIEASSVNIGGASFEVVVPELDDFRSVYLDNIFDFFLKHHGSGLFHFSS